MGEQVEGLEHEADGPVAQTGERVVVERRRRSSLEEMLAAGGAVEAAEDRQERRLARARGSHDRQLLALAGRRGSTSARATTSGRPRGIDAGHAPQRDERCRAALRTRAAPLKSGQRGLGIAERDPLAAARPFSTPRSPGWRDRGPPRAGAARRPATIDDVAAVLLEDRLERDEERARALLDLDLDPRRHARPQPRLRLVDLDRHAEELGPAPLLLLLGQGPHQGDRAGEPQVRVGLARGRATFWFRSTLWMSVSRTWVSTTIFEMSGRMSSGWLAQTWSPTWGLRCSEPKNTSR